MNNLGIYCDLFWLDEANDVNQLFKFGNIVDNKNIKLCGGFWVFEVSLNICGGVDDVSLLKEVFL
jgi:hypothetical protein